MLKIKATIISICFISFCFAQTSIQVKSFENHRSLAFASVVNLNKDQLHFTDENGNLTAKFDTGDSVFISYVGYQSLKERITDEGGQTFLLKPSNTILEPVKVVNCKSLVKNNYSNLNGEKFGGVGGWRKGAMNSKIAVMVKPGYENARLNAFSIWIVKSFTGPKSAIHAPVIFSFYSVDDSSQLPGELITNQTVIWYPQKEGKQTILVDSLHLWIPKSGIYVGIEYVYNEKYQYPMRYFDGEKLTDSVFMVYGGNIDGVFSRDFNLAFLDYKRNNWAYPMNRDKSILTKVRGTIKFSAELTTCKEEN